MGREKEGGLIHVMGAAPAASSPTVCRWPSPPTALLAVLLTSGPPSPRPAFETGPPLFSQFSLCRLDLPMAPWALGAAGD